ncbi:MAG: hypothetical protein AAF413_00050 [Patescibacteria group bacterium]
MHNFESRQTEPVASLRGMNVSVGRNGQEVIHDTSGQFVSRSDYDLAVRSAQDALYGVIANQGGADRDSFLDLAGETGLDAVPAFMDAYTPWVGGSAIRGFDAGRLLADARNHQNQDQVDTGRDYQEIFGSKTESEIAREGAENGRLRRGETNANDWAAEEASLLDLSAGAGISEIASVLGIEADYSRPKSFYDEALVRAQSVVKKDQAASAGRNRTKKIVVPTRPDRGPNPTALALREHQNRTTEALLKPTKTEVADDLKFGPKISELASELGIVGIESIFELPAGEAADLLGVDTAVIERLDGDLTELVEDRLVDMAVARSVDPETTPEVRERFEALGAAAQNEAYTREELLVVDVPGIPMDVPRAELVTTEPETLEELYELRIIDARREDPDLSEEISRQNVDALDTFAKDVLGYSIRDVEFMDDDELREAFAEHLDGIELAPVYSDERNAQLDALLALSLVPKMRKDAGIVKQDILPGRAEGIALEILGFGSEDSPAGIHSWGGYKQVARQILENGGHRDSVTIDIDGRPLSRPSRPQDTATVPGTNWWNADLAVSDVQPVTPESPDDTRLNIPGLFYDTFGVSFTGLYGLGDKDIKQMFSLIDGRELSQDPLVRRHQINHLVMDKLENEGLLPEDVDELQRLLDSIDAVRDGEKERLLDTSNYRQLLQDAFIGGDIEQHRPSPTSRAAVVPVLTVGTGTPDSSGTVVAGNTPVGAGETATDDASSSGEKKRSRRLVKAVGAATLVFSLGLAGLAFAGRGGNEAQQPIDDPDRSDETAGGSAEGEPTAVPTQAETPAAEDLESVDVSGAIDNLPDAVIQRAAAEGKADDLRRLVEDNVLVFGQQESYTAALAELFGISIDDATALVYGQARADESLGSAFSQLINQTAGSPLGAETVVAGKRDAWKPAGEGSIELGPEIADAFVRNGLSAKLGPDWLSSLGPEWLAAAGTGEDSANEDSSPADEDAATELDELLGAQVDSDAQEAFDAFFDEQDDE